MEKIKIVIVCHYSNSEVRGFMRFSRRLLYNAGRRFLGLEPNNKSVGDISPWVTYLVDHLRIREDINLHVVSSHSSLRRGEYHFYNRGVDFHFVNIGCSTLLKYVLKKPEIWHKFNPLRRRVKKTVDSIHPDLVALIGAENGFIADTVLDLFDYPVIIQCQTIYNNPERLKYDQVDPINAWVEKELFKKARYVAIPTTMHRELFLEMEQNAVIFDWKAKTPLPIIPKPDKKEYDFVCFAVNMSEKKGFPDAVEAMALVCKKYPDATLNLVGGGSAQMKDNLRRLSEHLGVEKNIVFTDFFEMQIDLFKHIQKSRFAVLPCKLDHVSGTMTQAMNYGLPLICYKTSGTPLLNEVEECVLVAELGNINELAEKMLLLLDNPQKGISLASNSLERLKRKNNMPQVVERLVDTYKAIVNKERNNIDIPQELLFNPNAV